MPIDYKPLKGKAGIIKFMLFRYGNIPLNTVSLHVVDFKEGMEDSARNEVYEDILGSLQKSHVGYRQIVSFSAVNARGIPAVPGGNKSNRRAIQEVASMINDINTNPDTYVMRIWFRDGSGNSGNVSMGAVVYTGKPSLEELVADSNTAQLVPFEFKSKMLSQLDFGYDTNEPPVIVTEDSVIDGTGDIKVITDEQGNPLICEFNQYSNAE